MLRVSTLIQHQNNKISIILIIMFRNKDKQNKIPLEKKLTKEPTKYNKQYKQLDYDTLKYIVDTKSNYLINTIKNTTSNTSTTMLPHKKHINNKKNLSLSCSNFDIDFFFFFFFFKKNLYHHI